jgi:hypothetical protein
MMAYIQTRKVSESIPMLEKHVRENPGSADSRFVLCAAYLVTSRDRDVLRKALRLKEAAEDLGGHAPTKLLQIAAAAYLKLGEAGKALCDYADAVGRGVVVSWEKEVGPAMLRVSKDYRNRVPQSERVFKAIRRLADAYPGKPLVHVALSFAYLPKGKADDALEEILLGALLMPEYASRLSPYIDSLGRVSVAPEARAERAKQRFQEIRASAGEDRKSPGREETGGAGDSPGEHAPLEDIAPSGLKPHLIPTSRADDTP